MENITERILKRIGQIPLNFPPELRLRREIRIQQEEWVVEINSSRAERGEDPLIVAFDPIEIHEPEPRAPEYWAMRELEESGAYSEPDSWDRIS